MASEPTPGELADYIVDIPEEIVAAIGRAAVQAYIAAEKEHKRRYHQEYDRVRREVKAKRLAEVEAELRERAVARQAS